MYILSISLGSYFFILYKWKIKTKNIFQYVKKNIEKHSFIWRSLDAHAEEDDEHTESLKKLTSDNIHAATHHWYWVDTIVHVLIAILIIVVAARMKLMNVANLNVKNLLQKIILKLHLARKLIKNS